MGGMWVEQQQWLLPIELLPYTSLFSSWSTLHSKIVTEANIVPALSVLDDQFPDIQLARKLTYSVYYGNVPSLSSARRLECWYNSQWRNIRPHCGDCSDDKWNLPPAFGRVWCCCECVTLTWVSSLSNQYRWGSISPAEASSKFIWIRVQWPCLECGQHSPKTCPVLNLQKDIIQREPTWGSLSTLSPNINEWGAITWWDFTTCRLGSTRAIMVRLELVHLNGHRCA